MGLRQRLKDFRSKYNKWKVQNSRPPNNTNVPPEPTEKPKGTTASGESEDLWKEAEQRLIKDERMAPILKEASRIIEESGLKIGSPGTADHQQLGSFLDTQVEELEDKRWIIHFGDHFISVRDQLTRIFKNIIVLKDIVNTAASSTPPVAMACASVTVSLLVRLPADAFCYLRTHWLTHLKLYIQAVEQQDKLLEGLEKVSSLIPRLHMMEDLYFQSDTNVHGGLIGESKKALISLYCKVLEFQAHALCFLRKNSFSQGFRNMLKQDS